MIHDTNHFTYSQTTYSCKIISSRLYAEPPTSGVHLCFASCDFISPLNVELMLSFDSCDINRLRRRCLSHNLEPLCRSAELPVAPEVLQDYIHVTAVKKVVSKVTLFLVQSIRPSTALAIANFGRRMTTPQPDRVSTRKFHVRRSSYPG
jgi:hypothetical protein